MSSCTGHIKCYPLPAAFLVPHFTFVDPWLAIWSKAQHEGVNAEHGPNAVTATRTATEKEHRGEGGVWDSASCVLSLSSSSSCFLRSGFQLPGQQHTPCFLL
eukprot:5678399-Pyramimonas_sp.AAC.1